MPQSEADARIVNDNLQEAMRFFGRAHPRAEVREYPGVSLVFCGLNYAAFNAAVMGGPAPRSGIELRQRIEIPADHFEKQHLRWSYWFCTDLMAKPLVRQARSMLEGHGLGELTDAPGMIADALAAPARPLPQIEVRSVCDPATRSAFAHITSIAFEVPGIICRDVYGAERAWDNSFRGFVAYVDGMAVATTAIVVAAGVAGVYSVGTLPGYRGRGYAEALMRQALDRVRGETGVERTALQSTRTGYSLYTRMGYRAVTNFTVYITD